MAVPRVAFKKALAPLYDWLDTQFGSSLSAAELAVLDGAAAANTGSSKAVITGASGALAIGGAVTVAEAKDIAVGTSTGTKIGTATSQKLAFWNKTPIIQPASALQAAVVTTGATQSSPYGFATAAQADGIVALVNQMRTDLINVGIIKGAA